MRQKKRPYKNCLSCDHQPSREKKTNQTKSSKAERIFRKDYNEEDEKNAYTSDRTRILELGKESWHTKNREKKSKLHCER